MNIYTKRHPVLRHLLPLGALSLLILASCRTVPTDIPEGQPAPLLFQQAQEAVDNNNFGAALAYYQAVLDRFEDDLETSTIALYEIGFVHYRQNRYNEARPYFERVVERYENGQGELPQWPLVLSRRFLDRMN